MTYPQGKAALSTRPSADDQWLPLSRRGFLAAVAGAAAFAAAGCQWIPKPPNFPAGIWLYQQAFQNWAGEIKIEGVWTCSPNSPADIVSLANWARANGYKLRPRGAMHNWSPLTLKPGASLNKVVLVDTTQHLTAISVNTTSSPATVTAESGAMIEAILGQLQNNNLGWASVTAPGNITIGGALAIDAHGAALPAVGETLISGSTYGSLCNLVTSLTACVWDGSKYALKTFSRSDPHIKAFLTHLGRAFVTSVTLQAGANYRLRCQSFTDIPVSELFAPQGSSGRTFTSYLDASGRVEAIWFPFTNTPWLKVWTPTPTKPAASTAVTAPYNYPFSDSIPLEISQFLSAIVKGDVSGTPGFGQFQLDTVKNGLGSSADIWGWSKDSLLYIRPTTLRVSEGGAAVLCNRSNVQRVLNEFTTWYSARLAAYQAVGKFPMNAPVEIRCCGLDRASDVKVPSSGAPQLSALRPRPDHPEWDTAVWLDVLTIPNTPSCFEFYRDMEQWMFSNYTGSYACVRPEWSKGWAFTNTAGWADTTMLQTTIPNAYRAGQPAGDNWDTALSVLDSYDPLRIFSNGFIDTLLP